MAATYWVLWMFFCVSLARSNLAGWQTTWSRSRLIQGLRCCTALARRRSQRITIQKLWPPLIRTSGPSPGAGGSGISAWPSRTRPAARTPRTPRTPPALSPGSARGGPRIRGPQLMARADASSGRSLALLSTRCPRSQPRCRATRAGAAQPRSRGCRPPLPAPLLLQRACACPCPRPLPLSLPADPLPSPRSCLQHCERLRACSPVASWRRAPHPGAVGRAGRRPRSAPAPPPIGPLWDVSTCPLCRVLPVSLRTRSPPSQNLPTDNQPRMQSRPFPPCGIFASRPLAPWRPVLPGTPLRCGRLAHSLRAARDKTAFCRSSGLRVAPQPQLTPHLGPPWISGGSGIFLAPSHRYNLCRPRPHPSKPLSPPCVCKVIHVSLIPSGPRRLGRRQLDPWGSWECGRRWGRGGPLQSTHVPIHRRCLPTAAPCPIQQL